jgi:hypothetical protein
MSDAGWRSNGDSIRELAEYLAHDEHNGELIDRISFYHNVYNECNEEVYGEEWTCTDPRGYAVILDGIIDNINRFSSKFGNGQQIGL